MLATVGLVTQCSRKRQALVASELTRWAERFWMSRPAQMKSAAVGLDEEDDSSEDDELSSLILLCRSRKNEERGVGW